MTKSQANYQIEAFFRKLGMKASFSDGKNFVKASVGESVIGFEFIEYREILNVKALIYRFRNAPREEILTAIYKENNEFVTGAGKLIYDENDLSLFLEKDFSEPLDERVFYTEINALAQESLVWSSRKLSRIAGNTSKN